MSHACKSDNTDVCNRVTEEGPNLLNNILCIFLEEMVGLQPFLGQTVRHQLPKLLWCTNDIFVSLGTSCMQLILLLQIKTKKEDISTVKNDWHL